MYYLLLLLCTTTFIVAQQNYYLATHNSYANSTLNSIVISSRIIAGNVASVTQQCRRTCTQTFGCHALRVMLIVGDLSLGRFNCNFLDSNTCNWQHITLKKNSSVQFSHIWDKLDAANFKAKSCVEYCAVRFRGDCKACRGYSNLTGIDCDIAPKLCSGYNVVEPGWVTRPIWPWGFYGRKVMARCHSRDTIFLSISTDVRNSQNLFSIGWESVIYMNNLTMFIALQQRIEWELISELVALSQTRVLTVYINPNRTGMTTSSFSGLKLNANGELSLNVSLDIPELKGFPVPFNNAPFVNAPNSSCGSFWQFDPQVSVCEQRTNLLNFRQIRWNGTVYKPVYAELGFE